MNWGDYFGPGRALIDSPLGRIPRLLAIWEGGLVFYGGFIGAALTAWWYLRRHRMPFLAHADTLIPSVAFGHFLGRLGCFAAGCCWGGVAHAHLPWAARFPPESLAYQTFATARPGGLPRPGPAHDPAAPPDAALRVVRRARPLPPAGLVVRPRKRFHGQVLATWLLVYAVLRTVVESSAATSSAAWCGARRRAVDLARDLRGGRGALGARAAPGRVAARPGRLGVPRRAHAADAPRRRPPGSSPCPRAPIDSPHAAPAAEARTTGRAAPARTRARSRREKDELAEEAARLEEEIEALKASTSSTSSASSGASRCAGARSAQAGAPAQGRLHPQRRPALPHPVAPRALPLLRAALAAERAREGGGHLPARPLQGAAARAEAQPRRRERERPGAPARRAAPPPPAAAARPRRRPPRPGPGERGAARARSTTRTSRRRRVQRGRLAAHLRRWPRTVSKQVPELMRDSRRSRSSSRSR